MADDKFTTDMMTAKYNLANMAATIVDMGISAQIVCAACGSVAGNLIGMHVKESELDNFIAEFIKPLKADAIIAIRLREADQRKTN